MDDHRRIYFTTKELAARWRMSPRTLEGWRLEGIGPAPTKLGSRVRYHIDAVERVEREWPAVTGDFG